MATSTPEGRRDLSSSPIQNLSPQQQQAHQLSTRTTSVCDAPMDKENCVHHLRQTIKGENQKTTIPLKSPTINAQKRCRQQLSNGVFFQPPQESNDTSGVREFTTPAAPLLDLFHEIDNSYSFRNHMEDKRRRLCSDPVAAFLMNQKDEEEDTEETRVQPNEILPLQDWSNNWRETFGSNSNQLIRPKPIRPSTIAP